MHSISLLFIRYRQNGNKEDYSLGSVARDFNAESDIDLFVDADDTLEK